MANEELEKLKQKVEKDPLSKLFVPLAEEYRKLGMLDEAISVLLKGLETQPNYMTARVALGKIYLAKNMLKEAREEFKKVIKAIPDNLFALKKVAEISQTLGDIPEAIEAYSRITKLNPLDEEAKANLENLKNQLSPQPEPPASKPIEIPRPEEPSSEGKEIETLTPESETSYSEEEFEKFKNEFLSRGALHPEPQETPVVETPESPSETEIQNVEIPEEEGEVFFIDSSGGEVTVASGEVTVEETILEKGPMKSEAITVSTEQTKGEPDFSIADRLISENKYLEAAREYKRLLKDYPEDRRILQRMEELKALLKLLGKGNELIIGELNNLLEAIKKRRDEFFKNP